MKVAVLQPTYLPWCGYFALMDSVDTFIYYDDVQMSVQSWQQRNKIKTSQGVTYLTVPIRRESGQRICDVSINFGTDWRRKHWQTIKQAYSKAPYFDTYGVYVEDFYGAKWFLLSDYCMDINRYLAMMLDIKMPKVLKSSAMFSQGSKTDRLISLLKNIGATEYVSAPAARNYIEPVKFEIAEIKLTWFNYKHPVYPQIRGDFIPYMSVIDLLFNTGEEAIKYIRSGCEK